MHCLPSDCVRPLVRQTGFGRLQSVSLHSLEGFQTGQVVHLCLFACLVPCLAMQAMHAKWWYKNDVFPCIHARLHTCAQWKMLHSLLACFVDQVAPSCKKCAMQSHCLCRLTCNDVLKTPNLHGWWVRFEPLGLELLSFLQLLCCFADGCLEFFLVSPALGLCQLESKHSGVGLGRLPWRLHQAVHLVSNASRPPGCTTVSQQHGTPHSPCAISILAAPHSKVMPGQNCCCGHTPPLLRC